MINARIMFLSHITIGITIEIGVCVKQLYNGWSLIVTGLCSLLFLFFFQAEDGIRDATVTGVQTCALPISPDHRRPPPRGARWCSRRRSGSAYPPVIWWWRTGPSDRGRAASR